METVFVIIAVGAALCLVSAVWVYAMVCHNRKSIPRHHKPGGGAERDNTG